MYNVVIFMFCAMSRITMYLSDFYQSKTNRCQEKASPRFVFISTSLEMHHWSFVAEVYYNIYRINALQKHATLARIIILKMFRPFGLAYHIRVHYGQCHCQRQCQCQCTTPYTCPHCVKCIYNSFPLWPHISSETIRFVRMKIKRKNINRTTSHPQ